MPAASFTAAGSGHFLLRRGSNSSLLAAGQDKAAPAGKDEKELLLLDVCRQGRRDGSRLSGAAAAGDHLPELLPPVTSLACCCRPRFPPQPASRPLDEEIVQYHVDLEGGMIDPSHDGAPQKRHVFIKMKKPVAAIRDADANASANLSSVEGG